MGAKYSYRTYNDRFFLQPADHPEEVETLILPDIMNGKRVAYAEFNLSGYTNLKTLIMFDDGYYCKEVLKELHVENLYLPINFNINDTVVGLTCDNLYYVGTFDNYWLSTTGCIQKIKSLNAKHYYYYDWSSIYFDNTANYLKENENINFEKLQSSACKYTEESFYLVPNYSITFNKGGATYLHNYSGSACPDFKTLEEFPSKMISIDSRVKTIKLNGQVGIDLTDKNLELIDARSLDCANISEVKADIVLASNNSKFISLYGKANKLYLFDDYDNTIDFINGTGSNINEIYIPDTDSAKAHFKKIIDSYSAKIHYYTELPAIEFKFTDNEGENLYKSRNFDADIDYCLINIDILAYNGETVTSDDYLEDKFETYNLSVSPDIQKYKISFDCKDLTNVDDIKSKTIDNLPTPEVEHYTFKGWYLDQDYNHEVTLGTPLESDITLYGKFEHNKYILKFNTAGIGETPETLSVAYIESLPKLKTTDKMVTGWYYDNTLTNKATVGDELTETTTLFAKWEDLKYEVSFNTNNLVSIDPIYTLKLENLPTPNVEGYTFEGWFYDNNYYNKVNINDNLTDDITLYAKLTSINGGYYIAEPNYIYSSSTIDAMRFLSQCKGGLVYNGNTDVTKNATITYAHNSSLTNLDDYEFTLISIIDSQNINKKLNVKIDNTLDNIAIMISKSGDLYIGFNYDDYENLDELKQIVTNFLKSKLNINNPNIEMPEVTYLETKTYQGTYTNGNVYILASGVNLRFSNSNTPVDESTLKEGYTACDRFIFTSDFKPEEAIREIAPYILKNDGTLVKNYKIDIKLGANNRVTLKYMVDDKQVLYRSLSYQIIDSNYSFIAGFNNSYHDSVLLVNKTKEDVNFNLMYKEVLKKGYSYINTLDTDYKVSLKDVSTKTFTDTIMRGNGSYYESNLSLHVVDQKKANKAGADIITLKDIDGNEIKYEYDESFMDKVNNFMDSFKDKMESSKPFKIGMIAAGSVLGILLIYVCYLLIRKFTKWLKRR